MRGYNSGMLFVIGFHFLLLVDLFLSDFVNSVRGFEGREQYRARVVTAILRISHIDWVEILLVVSFSSKFHFFRGSRWDSIHPTLLSSPS